MPPDISFKNSGFNLVKLGKVSVQHDLKASYKINPLCDVLNSDDLSHFPLAKSPRISEQAADESKQTDCEQKGSTI